MCEMDPIWYLAQACGSGKSKKKLQVRIIPAQPSKRKLMVYALSLVHIEGVRGYGALRP